MPTVNRVLFAGRWVWLAVTISCVAVPVAVVLRSEAASSKQILSRELPNGLLPAPGGVLYGDAKASVRIVVFADFECRYCRVLHATLDTLLQRHPGGLAVEYRHFPLSRVGYAVPSAVAAECAHAQGRFREFAALLYAHQDEALHVQSLDDARNAGVPDLHAFAGCEQDTLALHRVQRDAELGRALGITATPAVVLGSTLYVGNVSLETIERFLAARGT
jgi:protein-disulfide isomerase